ncbi:MAG: phosphoribosyltransferase family protein [Nitrososphaerales archaeon]
MASFEYIQSVIDRLRIVKGGMTYSEMESSSGIHSTLLCRYVTVSTRPSREQSKLLERTLLRKSWFKEKLKERMVITNNGYLDLHQITSDPYALRWVSAEVTSEFSRMKCDRVLTAASSGIALATAVAIEMQVPVVYAAHTKSAGAVSYFEADLPSSNPSEISTLYLPTNLAAKGDSILIVDDVATSGRTMIGLITLVRKAGCRVSGVFVLSSRSDVWRERIFSLLDGDAKISVLFDLH